MALKESERGGRLWSWVAQSSVEAAKSALRTTAAVKAGAAERLQWPEAV